MEESTLKKLKLNPHYKMSDKQKRELEEIERAKERKPMVEFGQPRLHQNRSDEPQFETHSTNVIKRGRTKK